MITQVYPPHMFPQDFWRLSIEDGIDGKINNVTTKGSDDGISTEGPKKFREHVLSLCGYRTSSLQICTKNLR